MYDTSPRPGRGCPKRAQLVVTVTFCSQDYVIQSFGWASRVLLVEVAYYPKFPAAVDYQRVTLTMNSICHMTVVHSRFDERIFQKECRSLANDGFVITLMVADGKGPECVDGIQVVDIGAVRNRWQRFFVFGIKALMCARNISADIYHLHDPELLWVGYLLKLSGYKVVFDAHELTSLQIKIKHYIPKAFRYIVSRSYIFYEAFCVRKMDAIVIVQDSIMRP